jgi:hypothetical protein
MTSVSHFFNASGKANGATTLASQLMHEYMSDVETSI